MEESKCYINGIGIISPQKTCDNEQFLTEVITYDKNVLTSVTPDFKAFINPVQLRRLSRMLRIGMSAATICLKDADIKIPDGIITATGYGFLEETEKFLKELLDRNEKQLTPTYFMQGTYNALAGLVALSVKCTGYNNTYVSKGFAFENALHDAILQVGQNKDKNFLVGCYDEAAAVQYTAGMREHQFKVEHISNLEIFSKKSEGCIQGEGSAFFDLCGQPSASTWCMLKDIHLVYRPESCKELHAEVDSFLKRNNVGLEEIDLFISGMTGDTLRDQILEDLERTPIGTIPRVYFKHLCGEYCTSIAFGLWLGSSILKKQYIPEIVKSSGEFPTQIETVLLVNHYMNRNYSFILLKRFKAANAVIGVLYKQHAPMPD